MKNDNFVNGINVKKTQQENLFADRLITIFFFTAILLGVCLHFTALLPERTNTFLYISSLVFGYAGIFIFIIKTSSDKLKHNRIFYWWILIVVYMTSFGMISSGGKWRSHDSLSWFVTQDLRYVMYMAIGFALANKAFIKKYHKLMKFLGGVCIVFGILALKDYNFNINIVASGGRIGIWDISYYYWWLSASIFAYNFSYSRITGKDKFIGYGSFITYLVIGMLFLKRSVLINILALLTFTTFLNSRQDKVDKKINPRVIRILIVGALLIVVILVLGKQLKNSYFGVVFDSLINRFTEGESLGYDRTNEASKYFASVSPIYYIMGQGLGNYVITDHFLNALHIGLYNIIYKGGIFYFAFWIYLIIDFIKKIFIRKQLSQYNLVCLCVALSATLSMLYELSFTYTIDIIGYATPIAYLVQSEKGDREEI